MYAACHIRCQTETEDVNVACDWWWWWWFHTLHPSACLLQPGWTTGHVTGSTRRRQWEGRGGHLQRASCAVAGEGRGGKQDPVDLTFHLYQLCALYLWTLITLALDTKRTKKMGPRLGIMTGRGGWMLERDTAGRGIKCGRLCLRACACR